MAKMFRQGDILILAIDKIPNSAREVSESNLVLAEGEATGHAHRIKLGNGILGFRDKSQFWLKCEVPGKITHEEHGTIPLETGTYEVRQQRIYHYGPVQQID
jgi:hypothetical protein